jgi:hypothetical protein
MEAGDHKLLVKMSDQQFSALMQGAKHGHFCRHVVH